MSVVIHKTVDGRKFVRTPDEFFQDLPDFPYAPSYVEVDGLRIPAPRFWRYRANGR